jgi:hypothetical protein
VSFSVVVLVFEQPAMRIGRSIPAISEITFIADLSFSLFVLGAVYGGKIMTLSRQDQLLKLDAPACSWPCAEAHLPQTQPINSESCAMGWGSGSDAIRRSS